MTSAAICELPLVLEQSALADEWLLKAIADACRDRPSCLAIGDRIRSPLEAVFALWWDVYHTAHERTAINLYSQQRIVAGYVADFAVVPADAFEWYLAEQSLGMKWSPIVVELDGHDYHERTKAQVTLRNRRDRAFQVIGAKVFHFSGSELVGAPLEVVTEVAEFSHSAWCDFHIKFQERVAERLQAT